ncbi:MAG: MBOAT family protein [Clostridia bacterium]|nr:MBOAT family protein [Clostridia bacterium]
MVFSSLLFLCAFLPLQLIVYRLVPGLEKKNIVLLVFSLIFYAWGEPVYVLLLLGMSFVCWFCALRIKPKTEGGSGRGWLALAVAVCLGLLCIFKYGSFLAASFYSVFGIDKEAASIPLPIGISFYTFQLITYVVDVYRGDSKPQARYYRVLLYASLFHQCIAGPIVRYGDIENALTSRRVTLDDFATGVNRFSVGLAKKALLANNLGAIADMTLLSDSAAGNTALLAENVATLSSRSAVMLWLGMLCYAMQIYLDFSAYSDMAIGMGLMVGFRYKENFRYPYMSSTVGEFWRRWHISLGTFFRDYVYIPLGGNRKGLARTIVNLFIVWALTGLWHGAGWNFVLWGLYFFVFLVFERTPIGKKYVEKAPKALKHALLLLAVYFGWILFKFNSLTLGATVLKGMFLLNSNPFASFEAWSLIKGDVIFIIICVIACTPAAWYIDLAEQLIADKNRAAKAVYTVKTALVPLVLIAASVLALVGNSYNPFLYFQF